MPDAPARERLRNFVLDLAGISAVADRPFTTEQVEARSQLLDQLWVLVNAVMAVELRQHANALNDRVAALDPHGTAW